VRIDRNDVLLSLAYVAAYVAMDGLSYVQPLLKLGITPWNPQAGLTLAFLLTRGWRRAPYVAAAALIAELLVRGSAGAPVAVVVACVTIALGYGGLALFLSRYGRRSLLDTRRGAVAFSVAAVGGTLAIAIAYVAPFVAADALPLGSSGYAVARYWVGDLNGILTVTPLLLKLRPSRLHETLEIALDRSMLIFAQAVALSLTIWLVFGARPTENLQFEYALFAPVAWITLTWGVVGASLATLVMQIGLMAGAESGLRVGALFEIQFLLMTLGLTALLLGAVLAERARALERVAASESEQRALLAAAPDAVLATDASGRIVSANPAAATLLRLPVPQLVGSRVERWIPGIDPASKDGRARVSGARADDTRFPAEVAWVRLEPPARRGTLLIVRDSTERETAAAQLRERDTALARAMRFAVAGELATALTHELNQPITALVSYLRAVEILSMSAESSDPRLKDTVHKAMREAMRASDVLRRLRDFYRTGTAQLGELDVASTVDEVVSSFRERAARLRVVTSVDLGALPRTTADRTQLQMVLHNLVANALDVLAKAPAERRRLAITGRVANGTLSIAVTDTGTGVSADVADQLFEPFVTDKPDGMGLGLAISRSLMRSQGGELRLESTGEDGTCFVVELPVRPVAQVAA
jgi:two-component system sensor kinase FixL